MAALGNIALDHAKKNVSDSRSELGFRTDNSFATADGTVMVRTSLAWTHDDDPNRSGTTAFQSFAQPVLHDHGAEQAAVSRSRKWLYGWSDSASFKGEFSGDLYGSELLADFR